MAQRYRKMKINGRTVSEHRYVMEQVLDRELLPGELVHHKNGDKFDNRPDNLEIRAPKSHSVHHNQKHPLTKNCEICGKEFTPHPTKRERAKTCSPECRNTLLSRLLTANPVIPPWAKFDHEKAEEIRARHAAGGVSMRALAREYGVHHATISAIVRGKSWK